VQDLPSGPTISIGKVLFGTQYFSRSWPFVPGLIYGIFINREIPPETSGALPPGATPLKSETASEQVATAVAPAANDVLDERYNDNGQIGVAYRFLGAMREGRVEEGLALADKNWQLCRIQA
jgi:hypothetical protein